MKYIWLGLALIVLGAIAHGEEPRPAFVEVDYAKVERRIVREPRYVAQPKYALFILDAAGKFRVWAVLDKSKADLPYYDVLYFDKNGNGDLTEPGERFTGTFDPQGKNLYIHVGTVAVLGTKLVHTDVKFITVEAHGYKGTWFSMKWDGGTEVSGGYTPFGYAEMTQYAHSPQEAPILRPTPLGPLDFAVFERTVTLAIGKASKSMDVQVGLGSAGSGPDTLCVVDERFLTPGKDVIVATLIAQDRDGRESRTRHELKQHC
jgi:hypothetical protein